MSKLSKAANDMRQEAELRLDETVTNFMGGESYTLNPLDTLKMISASSIFGEPSYYVDSKSNKKYLPPHAFMKYMLIPEQYEGKTTNVIMEDAIDKALTYDFKATLEWAVECRNNYNMRLNPQVIMVRASIHPSRKDFTNEYPGLFDEINQKVMSRADEPLTQMSYYLYNNKGKKNDIPSVIKRSWAKKISGLKRYQMAKYKNHEIGMINGVRLCHAHSPLIDELMQNGTIEVNEDQMTWENLRSQKKSWKEILETIDIGHMALLRNLRGIFSEIDDIEFATKILQKLKDGVVGGKQFPFRYYSALKVIEKESCNHKAMIIDALEECMDIACENFPKLKGKTMCLSDNSGSAWGAITSEYGTTTVAEIDNLSSVITAACSEDGYVGRFGDRLEVTPISKRRGILDQTKKLTADRGNGVGHATEGGIWIFLNKAIQNKEHWDNIFIYSDQQAGTGGLYGTDSHMRDYKSQGFACDSYGNETSSWSGNHINVFKLILEYRKKVNPKVNVFSVQTAGYVDNVLPSCAPRIALLSGWTGKEAVYADEMIRQWNDIDNRNN